MLLDFKSAVCLFSPAKPTDSYPKAVSNIDLNLPRYSYPKPISGCGLSRRIGHFVQARAGLKHDYYIFQGSLVHSEYFIDPAV